MNANINAALRLAIAALKDYRRRHFAIGHHAFMKGQVLIFTERDHESYERYSKAIEVIEGAPTTERKAINIKRLTKSQNTWLNNYQSATCLEPMFLEDLQDGTKSFEEVAYENIRWYEDHFADAMHSISHNIPIIEKEKQ